ncbi:hypothetical protein B7P43_G04400 [Cryptotermes secundus]|uniref:Tc1-like transposase DDE domain-containing protein n=1 Tax=Cryptotermes secundus TaxID=105785 RepID=A0A2J7PZX8_9NEOP|nr:hypothetical protein B7P43_G04400 [Cryptotermes secundus]
MGCFRPSYSPDLAQRDFHLFTHLNQFWGTMHTCSNKEVKMVKGWFSGLAADLYNTGKQKLITQYDKCLNLHGNYVEN